MIFIAYILVLDCIALRNMLSLCKIVRVYPQQCDACVVVPCIWMPLYIYICINSEFNTSHYVDNMGIIIIHISESWWWIGAHIAHNPSTSTENASFDLYSYLSSIYIYNEDIYIYFNSDGKKEGSETPGLKRG